MKQLTCEMCGSNDLLKQDGVFVCQTCGTKYSVEEARKMMIEGTVEVSGTVKVDQSHLIENFLEMASSAIASGNNSEAEQYCNKVIEIDPHNYKAFLYKGTATGWQSTFAKLRIVECVNCWKQALDNCDKNQKKEVYAYTDAEFKKIIIAMVGLAGNFVEDGVNEYNGTSYREGLLAILNCVKLYAKSINVAFPWEKTCCEASISVVPSLMKCAEAEVRLYHKIKPSSGSSYEDFIKEFLFCIDLLEMTATFGQEYEAKALCYEKAAEVMQKINTLPFYIWVDGDYRPKKNSGNHYGSEVKKYKQKAAEARNKQNETNIKEFWATNKDEYKFLNAELKKSQTERNKLDKANTGYSRIVLLDEHISQIEAILSKNRARSGGMLKSEIDFIKKCEAFWIKLSSENEYDTYLDQNPILKQARELEVKRESLLNQKKQIDRARKNAKPDSLLPTSLATIFGIILIVLGSILVSLDGSAFFLILGILVGAGCGILTVTSLKQYADAKEDIHRKETTHKKEVCEYNATIDQLHAVPKYTGRVDSDRIIKIPSKIDEN